MKSDLVDRLKGIYKIPITDGLGPVTPGGDPKVFTRTFTTPPIQHEAALAIEELQLRISYLEAELRADNRRKQNRNSDDSFYVSDRDGIPGGWDDDDDEVPGGW